MFDKPIDQVLQDLHTDVEKGLSDKQVADLMLRYGPNKLLQLNRVRRRQLLLKQFIDPIVIILFVAGGISILMGEYIDGSIIWMILVLNALLGWFQEFKAEKALSKLQKYSVSYAKVVRNSQIIQISTESLVPGDIVLLEAGDLIPADLRLIRTTMLQIQESILTGEAVAEIKQANAYLETSTPLGDRITMAFMGTSVTVGTGSGVVIATGMETELGRIAHLMQTTHSGPSPLTMQLKKLSMTLGLVVLALLVIIMIEGLITGSSMREIFMTAVGLAVSAIPEGLPAIITITLALGVQKMLRANVLVRDLKAIETLGSASIICTDKTGTLTTNKMTVTEVVPSSQLGLGPSELPVPSYVNGQATTDRQQETGSRKQLLLAMVHCNNAHLPNIGDPTELALLDYGVKQGVQQTLIRISEIPFTSESKYQITIHDTISYIKGAPECVLRRCTHVLQGDVVVPLDEEGKQRILGDNLEFASQGKRVLACGYAQHTEPGEDVLKGMIDFVYVGLVVMMDPPRPEVSEAIKQAHQAGIRVIMITGDNLNTAKSIGLSIGLEGKAYEGAMLDTANPHDLLIDGAIFARVNPSHKVLICKTLQEMGHRVIMTGDGVNDAPALKQADVGVAMAITGSDVSKEVADIVLRDDNFASIVSGIKEGRIIYNNIKNFVTFLLSVNFDEILLIMISIFVGRPLPMTAIQILWINLVTDGLPTIALGFDEGDPDVMNQPPRSNKEMILSGKWPTIIVASLISASVALLFFWYELDRGEPLSEARTALVTISILVECLIIFSIRSGAKPFWTAKTNRYLIGAILISVFLHIGLIYSPRNAHFGMSALDTQDRYWIIGLSFAGRVMMELYKMIVRKLK